METNQLKPKLRVGIDVNEVLRARWLQFDRFYAQEFGDDEITEATYIYDFYNGVYPFKETTEVIKELKEPEDMPDDINPLDYQLNEDGEANADFALFKTAKTKTLTAREVYNRFMYEDYVFEIHGNAPIMYRQMDLHVKEFYEKYRDTVEFTVFSKENDFSRPSTLFFLSKTLSRFPKYHFIETNDEVWNNVDVFITTDPEFLDLVPEGKMVIKLNRPYNEKSGKGSITPVLHIHDLFDNEEFEKIIKYNKPE